MVLERLVQQHRAAANSTSAGRASGDEEGHGDRGSALAAPDARQLEWFEMQLALEAMQEAQAEAIHLLDKASGESPPDELAVDTNAESVELSEGVSEAQSAMAQAGPAASSKALDTSKAPHAQVSMAPTLPTMPPLRSLGLTRERSDYGQTSQMRLPSEYTAVDLPDLLGFSWTPPQPRSRSATQ